VNRLEAWASVSQELTVTLESLADENAWEFRSFIDLSKRTEFVDPALVVIVGGETGISDFIQRYPEAYFILIAVPGSTPADRIAVIGPEGIRPDKIAFLSGYIAALVTPNWRTGVIAVGQSGGGQAALKSYLNGVVYFCGLCRPASPPSHAYPTSATVPASDEVGLSAGYDQLIGKAITTIGLTHEFSSGSVDLAINNASNSNVYWIGPYAPSEKSRDQWIATVQPNPSADLVEVYNRLALGENDILIPMTFDVRDINQDLLTEGKLRLVLDIKRDLESGIIDTGVDPQTGQDR
jgi:basic membrane lipoprotein Med (substrate-binding protein (PBP1-ABC) superfamily)